jgi:hypothetical protein
LTTATAFTANSDLVVIWTDNTNSYVSLVNDSQAGGVTATLVAAELTNTTIATLVGITGATLATFVSADFSFFA